MGANYNQAAAVGLGSIASAGVQMPKHVNYAPEPPASSYVTDQVSNLASEVEETLRLVQRLEDRLSAVLTQNAPETGASSQTAAIHPVPLAGALHQQFVNLGVTNSYLRSIIDRIGL